MLLMYHGAMGRFPEQFIQQVLQSTDIVELVGRYVSLKRKGKEFVGLCPFHSDNNPSLYVSPAKQIFKCFACGAGGNVLQFVMNYEKQSFPEAVRSLAERPCFVLVDGTRVPDIQVPAESIIGGDRKCVSVAAASIVAKVTRDRFMERMDSFYPRYGFRVHKGYGTRQHIDAIRRYGPTRFHRFSFEPVRGMVRNRA